MQIAYIKYRELKENTGILKPNYHLNYGKLRVANAKKNGMKFMPLGKLVNTVFTGGIFKRVFVNSYEFGIPYISAQHMMNSNPLESCKIISRKYTPRQGDMTLRKNQILVSCAGSVGNVRLITDDLDGVIGSQDIIRVICDDQNEPYGFIYAYLSSPTAFNYIQSFIYGSVVPRIEPKTLSNLPVPGLSTTKKWEIHQLISDASALRVEAMKLINEVHAIFSTEVFNDWETSPFLIDKAASHQIRNRIQSRFDASFHLNTSRVESFLNKQIKYTELGSLVSSPMFTGQRGKRNYVSDGLKFLSTSNIAEQNTLLIKKYLSWKTEGLKTLIVKKDWILVSSSGQEILGSCFLVDSTYNDNAVNQHSIRVIIDENKVSPHYVYGYLSSPKTKEYIRAGIYGSAILTINETYLSHLKIPILSEELSTIIENKVKRFQKARESANYKENEAIELIEKEIESWQN